MSFIKKVQPLKPLALLVFAFSLVSIIFAYNTREEKICGTVTSFKLLNTGGNIGAAAVGYVGYLLDVNVEGEKYSIQLTSNIINPKIGQTVTIKRKKNLFFRSPVYTIADDSNCLQ
jgi:hypothetical protein